MTIAVFLIIAVTVFISYKGLTNQSFFDGYKFEVNRIFIDKDYIRLVSSGFLHVSWGHLILNVITLYFFGSALESYAGVVKFLIIYFSSMVCGDLLSLFIHRNHGDYSSVGASGAVCGVMFALIALFPGMDINFFFLPLGIPSWIYGLAYVLFSIYGIRSGKDNIGHDAHLGGALAGMLIALLFDPSAFAENYFTILLIAVPAIVFIYLIISRPHILMVDNLFFKKHNDHYSIDHKYNEDRATKQNEIDRILDKISQQGIKSLTKKEKEILQEYSKTVK